MQKSAHSNPVVPRPGRPFAGLLEDKGQKFEPLWPALAFGHDQRNLARVQKADQKR